MFTKLLKHEWKSNSKLPLTLSAFILGIAVLAGLDIRLIANTASKDTLSDTMTLIMIPAVLFLFIAIISLAVYVAGVQLLLLYRFYKSRFTDEGYLTFTLPVKTSHIFLSAAVHILIWQVISAVVLFLCALVVIFIGVPIGDLSYTSYGEMFSELFSGLENSFQMLPIKNYLIVLPVSLISGVIVPLSCITVGAVVAKKHKILAAIGIIYGCSALTSIITGMISGISTVMVIQGIMDYATMEQVVPLLNAITPTLMAVFGYVLSIYLMKNKLNLP